MNITLFVHEVIDSECPFALTEPSDDLRECFLPRRVDPAILSALSELRAKFPREEAKVIAVCLQPSDAEETVRVCKAYGADEMLVVDGADKAVDPLAQAKLGAALVRLLDSDAVVCAQGDEYGVLDPFGAALAEELGWAQVNGVCSIEPGTGGAVLTVQRKLTHGDRERVTCLASPVLMVEGLMGDIPYPPFPAMVIARTAPVRTVSLDELEVGSSDLRAKSGLERTGFIPPRPRTKRTPKKKSGAASLAAMMGGGPKKKSGGMVEGEPADAAKQIISFLEEKEMLK